MILHDIIPPVVTPFHADESLDLDALQKPIDFVLSHRAHVIFSV